jgi:hypothetical protein
MMEKGSHARYGAATGILAVILIAVGFGIFSSDIPETDAAAQEWGSFFTDNQDQIQTGLTIVGIGLFFYIWFLGSLRDAIAGAEGGTGRLASIAYGGGLVGAAFFVVAITSGAAAAFRPEEVDPTLTRGLNDLGTVVGAPAAAGFTALFAATAVAGYRHGALPAPVAGLSALAAITQPLAYGVAMTDTGAFAADGVLGLWVPLATFVVGFLAISGALVSRAGEGGGAAGAR